MGNHRIYVDATPVAGVLQVIEGDEAKHAVRVKRLVPGDAVQLLDGAGTLAAGVVQQRDVLVKGDWTLPVHVQHVQRVEAIKPEVHVLSATPKGSRLDDMIDALSQAGAASWGPIETAHGVVDPGETKLARIQRIAVEASKQCGRPWLLRTEAKQTLAAALAWNDGAVVVADSSGEPYVATGAAQVRLLVGPEGGWTEQEIAGAREAGAKICSFGPHAMRIEIAAVVAAAVIIAVEQAASSKGERICTNPTNAQTSRSAPNAASMQTPRSSH